MAVRAALCCMIMLLLAAADAAALAEPTGDAGPAVFQDLYLEVSVNGEPTGLVVRFTRGQRGLRVSVDSVRELGLDPAAFGLFGQGEVDLDDVRGLRYEYDAGRQSLALRVDDALRAPHLLQARQLERAAPTPVAPGAVLNYDAYVQLRPQRSALVSNEFRYFNQRGVLNSSGLLTLSAQDSRYLRYETYWNESDPDTLRSFQLGDLISSSFSWNRSLRLGGVQWRKSFDLRPDLLSFPVAAVRGSALVPSSLSLYVNGVQQFAGSVPSGPFVVNQVVGISGAGEATVVTRDAFGRTTSTALPLYVDTRMLASGLSEYSVESGFVRRGFAQSSFAYKAAPVASGSVRYGWNDRLTVEAHGEAAAGLLNAGAGALFGLGQAGVINGSLTASAGSHAGFQGGAGYQYVGRRLGVDAQSLYATRDYADLAARDGSPVPRAGNRVSLNVALPGEQSVSLSFVNYRAPPADPARIVSLSYAITLFRRAFFSVSAFQDFKNRSNRGVFFGLSTSFGDRVAAGGLSGRQNGTVQRSANLMRTPDLDGGVGWALQRGDTGSTPFRQAQASYLSRYGQVSALVQNNGGTSSATVEASGSLVTMGGAVAAARNVGGGFALVSTGGVGDVPVVHENRPIGSTNAAGFLLIPNLNPYTGNRVSIDTSSLPVDARIATTQATVVPKRLSGVLVSLPVERYRAASVLLQDEQGKPLPLGTPVRHAESGATTIVGYDGIVFVDNLREDNQLQAGEGASACIARFAYQASADHTIPVIGPVACQGAQP
jgi:outer membrane usher protein